MILRLSFNILLIKEFKNLLQELIRNYYMKKKKFIYLEDFLTNYLMIYGFMKRINGIF